MTIDFSKQNSYEEKIELLRNLFRRFNENYGNLIDMNKVEEAINNIIIASGDMKNIPGDIRELLQNGKTGIFSDDDQKIYIKENMLVADLVHEVLHYLSKDSGGIINAIIELYDNNIFDENIKKFGEYRTVQQVMQLNESFTCFLTELIIPEFENKNNYQYGQKCIRDYYNGLIENNTDPRFLFDAYLNGNVKATERFKNSFGDNFFSFIDAIEQHYNILYYIVTMKQKEPTVSEEQVSLMIKKAVLEASKTKQNKAVTI